MLDAAQMVGQQLALGPAATVVGCFALRGPTLELLQLRLQARLVLGDRLFEEAPLLGAHRLGLGTELPRPQPCQIEGDLLQLGGLELQLGVLALELVGLMLDRDRLLCDLARLLRNALVALLQELPVLAQLPQHPLGQRRDHLGTQTLQVGIHERVHVEHVASNRAQGGSYQEAARGDADAALERWKRLRH